MAVLNITSKMAWWKIKIHDQDVSNLLAKYITGIDVTYRLNKPSKASIQVSSVSFIEGVFSKNMKAGIWMGWDRFNMAHMISGKLVHVPNGQASELITYTIDIADDSIEMSKEEKNKTFKTNQKSRIIKEIIGINGYDAHVDITDDEMIKSSFFPIQKKETDWQFLQRCAEQWNCLCWYRDGTVYFVDAESAHDLGNTERTKTISDLKDQPYELNYRLKIGKNNIAKISWKEGKTKEGTSGSPGATGTNEDGAFTSSGDYKFEYKGRYYRIGDKYKNASLSEIVKIEMLIVASDSEALLTDHAQYFVPIVHGEGTHKNQSEPAANKKKALNIEVELNKGDEFLRAPRKAKLSSGTIGHNTSDLPAYLFHEGKNGAIYNINEVKTSLKNGIIQTSLKATA